MPHRTSLHLEQSTALPLGLALHRTAKRVGLAKIAGTAGLDYQYLAACLNPNNHDKQPNLEQIEAVIECAVANGADQLLMASLGAMTNSVWLRMPDVAVKGQRQVIKDLAEISMRVAELANTVQESLADGVVDSDEMHILEQDVSKLFQSAQYLLATMRRQHEQTGGQ